MKKKFSFKNFKLLPKNQQVAIYALIISVLGFILIVGISSVLIFGGTKKPESSSKTSSSSSTSASNSASGEDANYKENSSLIDETEYKDVLLTQGTTADTNYLKETLFVGDSNTERLFNYSLIGLDNFVGKTGMGIQGVATEACVYFKNDNNAYTIPQAVAKMKPRRVVLTFGTNNAAEGISTDDFVKAYISAIAQIEKAYPYCDIIVNSVVPVAKIRTYKNISMQKIDEFNVALAKMAKDKGYKFLYSAEALRGEDGFGKINYYTKTDGIHLTEDGARAMHNYVLSHPYDAKDRRPDTKNIPIRRAAPSEPTSSTAPSQKEYSATYNIQVESSKALGYFKSDTFEKKTSYTHTFTTEAPSFTITAVALEGYVFDVWSDGVKDAKRTDKNLTENVKITAKFKKKGEALSFKLDKSSVTVNEETNFEVKAIVTGEDAEKAKAKVVWKFEGAYSTTGATYTAAIKTAGKYKLEASLEGFEKPITIEITVIKKAALPTITITAPASAVLGDTIICSASVENGEASKVKWTVNSVDKPVGSSISFVPDKIGSYIVVATIGETSKKITIEVSAKPTPSPTPTPTPPPTPTPTPPPTPTPTPTPPNVTLSIAGPTAGVAGELASFSANITGTPETPSWTVTETGDGTTAATFSFTPSAAGTYTIVMSVAGKSTSLTYVAS